MGDLGADGLQLPLPLILFFFLCLFLPMVTWKALRSSVHIVGLLCPGLLAALLAFGSLSRQKEGCSKGVLWLQQSLSINRIDCYAEVLHASNPFGIVIILSVRGSHTLVFWGLWKRHWCLSVFEKYGQVHWAQPLGSWVSPGRSWLCEQGASCHMGPWELGASCTVVGVVRLLGFCLVSFSPAG